MRYALRTKNEWAKIYIRRKKVMAGGTHAAVVPCIKCIGGAVRTYEGMETDAYECSECGHPFSIDWSHGGPPQKPCWPLSEEETKEARRIMELINERRSTGSEKAEVPSGNDRQ